MFPDLILLALSNAQQLTDRFPVLLPKVTTVQLDYSLAVSLVPSGKLSSLPLL
jgi:hypothetical protein